MVNEVIQRNIQPLKLVYENLQFFDKDTKIIRSFLEVESLDLGTLNYNQYRFVARRVKLGNELIARHIEKLFREYPNIILKDKVELITFPVTARFLLSEDSTNLLFDLLNYFDNVRADKICIEISADVLFEDVNLVKERIQELQKMGFKIAIFEVGDEYCPVFKLSELPFSYAFVDKYVVDSLDGEDAERIAGGILQFLKHLNVEVFAPQIEKKKNIVLAQNLGFDGYSFIDVLTSKKGSKK